ncbi:MAG: GNAT family N-acetyltransferase [Gammaproteobacteria bacterium]
MTASGLEIRVLTGRNPEFATLVPDLARLRITVFREFPYLYDGSAAYEEKYLATYTNCADSVAVIVRDGDRVVGASTGLPLVAETPEFQQPFLAHGYLPATIFYCGESVLLAEYRGRGLYRAFFEGREQHARTLRGFRSMALCAVVRKEDHPRRPPGYAPLDPVWQRFGYVRHPELVTQYEWQDLDEAAPSAKDMVFWLKSL